ncbi:uncharacterized protein BCR38DRAFT_3372 [Pseudomassariella vexata]|uniref:PH domain-containing protein n=1 Tax=Pseudomassariella vexata TaxID=1141098 RepID=A0A1Y2EIE8_9PEZI|nr:uncharacterized protein BCR38DRAFT_3372 [Pseudomassariella vexata]ORY71084.1 hypothetical protein BCR38DRAFT_3372 [Pseudomassariella vexata]
MSLSGPNQIGGPLPPKLSRYRSLRGKSLSTTAGEVNKVLNSTEGNYGNDVNNGYRGARQNRELADSALAPATCNSIARSMSRYRRRSMSVSAPSDVTPKITAPPPDNHRIPMTRPHADDALQKEGERSPVRSHASSTQQSQRLRHADRATTRLKRNMADHSSRPSTASDDSQRRTIASRDGRERLTRDEDAAARHSEQTASVAVEPDRRLAEQKKKDLERLQVQLANSQHPAMNKSLKSKSPVLEKFVNLTRGRKSKDGLSPKLSPALSPNGSFDFNNFNKSRENLPEVPKVPTGIEAGGKGIVPQTDAPVSAVNSGDRLVSVCCKHHTFILSVTPETTPIDIIFSAAKQMTYDLEVSPASCVVQEAYIALGLERRLRRFERIRDIMNSWDRDSHNHLIVSVSESPNHDRDLEVESVPKTEAPPQGCQVYLYHSNRPGKWSKRYVTLLDNGQIICSKKQNATSLDKETQSLCHLSDYDLYSPTESQMRRHLKPPKKHCFAVKSQNKPSMFMNTENYVQYFCTENAEVAAQFAEKVQGWRGWYLLDRRPVIQRIEIPKTDDKPPQLTSVKHAPKKSVNVAVIDGHRLKVSVDEAPYAIGEFEPLLDMKRFDKRLSQFGKDFLPPVPDVSTMPKEIQAQHESKSQATKPESTLIDQIKSPDDDAFTGHGLLGEEYKDRKAQQLAAEKSATSGNPFSRDEDPAFTRGPSLLNNQRVELEPKKVEISWFPSAAEHSAKYRNIADLRPSTSAGIVRQPEQSHRPPFGHQPLHAHANSASPSHSGQNRRPPGASSNPGSPSQTRRPPGSSSNRLRPDAHPQPLALQRPGSSGGLSQTGRRQPPTPLVSLTPEFNEPPQWARKKGHGVQAPEGMHHLVDLISVGTPKGGSSLLEVPPRSPMRRGPNTAPLPAAPSQRSAGGLARTRSKSQGAPVARMMSDAPPPLPPMPKAAPDARSGDRRKAAAPDAREGDRRKAAAPDAREERGREGRGRERQREAMPQMNTVPGRNGTLKVV